MRCGAADRMMLVMGRERQRPWCDQSASHPFDSLRAGSSQKARRIGHPQLDDANRTDGNFLRVGTPGLQHQSKIPSGKRPWNPTLDKERQGRGTLLVVVQRWATRQRIVRVILQSKVRTKTTSTNRLCLTWSWHVTIRERSSASVTEVSPDLHSPVTSP